MPQIGEVQKGKDIGKYRRANYIWHACVDCGKERWVQIIAKENKPKHERCYDCGIKRIHRHGENSSNWRGGRSKHSGGYIQVCLAPDDFFYSMAGKSGQILEHRLVMAKHLNRCLLPWEIVHHKNGIKDDNRIENLELMPSQSKHFTGASLIKKYKSLEKRIIRLEIENESLKQQLDRSKQ